jgi:hypothetical protein
MKTPAPSGAYSFLELHCGNLSGVSIPFSTTRGSNNSRLCADNYSCLETDTHSLKNGVGREGTTTLR